MPREKIKNQQKIFFVINPISGNIDKNNLETDIDHFMSKQNQQVEVYYMTGEGDKQKISNLIERTYPEKVVAVGGDGTCNLIGQILLNKNIKMGIIPLGSANGLATELDLPSELHENLNIILKGKSKKIDVIQFNKKYISLHLGDIGLNAKVVERFEKGGIRGFLGYGKYFFDELGKAQPAKFKIEIGNKTKNKKAVMIVIANAAKYGTGAIINPKGKPDDGRFEIVVIRPQKFMQLLKMVVPFFTRKIHTLNFVDIYSCKKVMITNCDHQMVQIDGEIIGQPEQIFVEIIPRSLQVMIP